MEKVQTEVISGYCAKLPRKAKELGFYHKTKDEDPDETVEILDDMTMQSYSLTCPLSQARQSVPVRTNSCSHVDTFDLASCIKALPNFELINCYSRLILKAQVDLPQNCPICKVKDTIYVDGIIETFIKFNPDIDRFKFTESGDAIANETFRAKFNETINLASPFPNCKVDVASSSCNFYSSPPFSDSYLDSSRLECSQDLGLKDPVAFGPSNRSGLSPPLSDLRKMCSPPEKINDSDVHSSLFDDPSRNASAYNPPAESLATSGFQFSNPFLFCRSPYYSQLYAEASAFQFPDSAQNVIEEAVVAVSRRRFSTVDLVSPRPIY